MINLRIAKTILEQTSYAFIVCDLQGNYLLYNQAAKDMLGLKEEDYQDRVGYRKNFAVTNELGELIPVVEYPIIKSLRGIITKKKRMCIKSLETEAEIFIDADAFPVMDENLNVIAGVTSFIDVTMNIRLEKQFMEMEERCRHLGNLIRNSFFK